MAVQYVNWADPVMLRENSQRLIQELKSKLQDFEARYETKSAKLQAAIEAGKIKETAEIAEWVVMYDAYLKVTNAQPTRLE